MPIMHRVKRTTQDTDHNDTRARRFARFAEHVTIAPCVTKETRRMKNTNFWIGNGLLALALVILVFMGTLSQMFGIGAVVVWMIVAAAGTYFIMKS